MAPSITLAEDTTIGNWIIRSELGKGGQGTVWAVKPTTTKRSPGRALKACFLDGPTDRARFELEIELLKRCVDAPNILRLVDSDPTWIERIPGIPAFAYYVSERCEGSLEERKNKLGDAGARLALFREACEAVRYLHELDEPLVHRDIKPANFLLANEPRRLVLADFGIAKPLNTEKALTQIQEVVGTQHFRAPEVSAGGSPTLRSDIFSLGRVLEWLLTGDISTDLSTRPVPRGDRLSDEACVLLDAVIVKATQPVAANRFASVREMLEQLPELWLSPRPRPQAEKKVPVRMSAREAVKTATAIAKADDRAGWREVELQLRNQYNDELRRWRGENEQIHVNDERDAVIAFAETLFVGIMPRLAFGLGGVLSQKEWFADQRRTMEHLLSVPDWNRGGRVLVLNAPHAAGFVFHYLHGALCCELDRFDLALQLATASYVDGDGGNKTVPTWMQFQLLGWPETLAHNLAYATPFLLGAFERWDFVSDLFPNAAEFQIALGSYSFLLSLLDMASSVDEVAAFTEQDLAQRISIGVPLVHMELARDRITAAARRTNANRQVVQQVAQLAGTTRDKMTAAWPNWKRVIKRNYQLSQYNDPLGDLG